MSTKYTSLQQATSSTESDFVNVKNIQSTFTDTIVNSNTTADLIDITVPDLEQRDFNNSGLIEFIAPVNNNANANISVNGVQMPMKTTSGNNLPDDFITQNNTSLGKIHNNTFYVLNVSGNFFGILPITKGGTGADNASGARANLGAASKTKYTTTLSTIWNGTSAPFTKTVTITGILSTDTPHITPIYSSDNITAIAEQKAWNYISKAETAQNSIVFTCFKTKPETALTLQIEVIR